MTEEELARHDSKTLLQLLLSADARCDALTAQLESTLKDRKLILEERDRTFALMLARAEKAEAERDRLRDALLDHNDLLRSALAIAKREGVEGQIASTNWDAYYNRVAVALKRHHQTANEALAALTQKDRTND